MTQQEAKSWDRMCLRKKRLTDWQCAQVVNRAKKGGTTLRYYYCPHCDGYHI